VGAGDATLAEALETDRPVLVDVGCGDGRHTVRWAQRRPDALVVGLDAETTRLDRSLIAVRRKKLPVLFVGAAVERPPAALLGRADELAAVMPWGSLLDGILGADPAVLRAVLALGGPAATLDAVVNVRPWDAPDSVDRKLAATPEPTAEHLTGLVTAYAELGWTLEPTGWLTDAEARALGSTWASRVVAARASRLLHLHATTTPAITSPATNPPATTPPATNPPATTPPATNPPATTSPRTGSSAVVPSAAAPGAVGGAGDGRAGRPGGAGGGRDAP
jgi:16S rRNA (adenine(1408)-N(1))-methyltransferase